LRRCHGKERIPHVDLLALLDIERTDDTFAVRENFHCAGRGGQKAADGLLARKLREGKEDNRDCHDSGEQPNEQLRRDRLQQSDVAEFALPALKLDRFLAKQPS